MKFRHWPCFDLENVWDLFFFSPPLFFSHLFWEFCEFLLRRPSWSTVTGLWIQSLNPNLTNQPLSTWSWSTATEMQYSSLDGLALCDLLHYLWHPLWFPSGRERQEASGYGLKVLRAESGGREGGRGENGGEEVHSHFWVSLQLRCQSSLLISNLNTFDSRWFLAFMSHRTDSEKSCKSLNIFFF